MTEIRWLPIDPLTSIYHQGEMSITLHHPHQELMVWKIVVTGSKQCKYNKAFTFDDYSSMIDFIKSRLL